MSSDTNHRHGQHPGADNHGGRGPKPDPKDAACGTTAMGWHPPLFGDEAQGTLGFVDGAMHRAAERELPIVTRGTLEHGVDARQLHKFLESKRDFTGWVKDQIKHCRLVAGRDFEVFASANEKLNDSTTPNLVYGENKAIPGSHSRARIDYVLSLDAAKHIGMASNTEVGFFAREYFIASERRLRAIAQNEPPRPIRQTPRPSAAREREARLAAKEQRLRSSAEAKELSARAKALLDVAREMRQVGAVDAAKGVLADIARAYGVEVRA